MKILGLQKDFNKQINYFSDTEYLVEEKKHHLDASHYRGNHVIAFTICIQERKPIFLNKTIFDIFEKSLLRALDANKCESIVYLFMPDHCHILASGKNNESDMKKMILYFKQLTGYWFSKNVPDVS
jgi:REP element-mobilizing transposase RayT